MKSAGKEMAVGGAGLRGGWAAARGRRSEAGRGWAVTAIAVMVAAGMVTGCGGGGGDESPAAAAAASTEKPVEQPILTMPTSTYTGMHAEAFKRINEARIAAGVSALKQSVELDRAAQAHSDYQVRNNVFGHYEDPAHPLFTGATPRDRAVAQKYPNTFKVEVVGWTPSSFTGAQHIDLHLNSVYHLQGILNPTANEAGIGIGLVNSGAPQSFASISLGVTDTRLRPAKNPFVWPADNSIGVPTSFAPATEVPNPLPDVAPNVTISVGPPIMFCQSLESTADLQIVSADIKIAATRTVESSWMLKHPSIGAPPSAHPEMRSDSALSNYDAQCIFLIPKSQLQTQTNYQVTVVSARDGVLRPTAWTFSTR